MQVIVHGGAGSNPGDAAARASVLDEAAGAGAREATPVDAVETALRTLESDPRFNAGVGSAVQSDGRIRTDAGLMTDDRAVGAACAMGGVEHAASAARAVLEETPHVLVSGAEAVDLADEFGVGTDRDLWTDRTRERWAEADPPDGGPREHLAWLRSRFGRGDGLAPPAGDGRPGPAGAPRDHDTVGGVAGAGDRVAAGTSTGGRWFALAGRVGDVPQVGSGFYCSPAGGASATGAGEDIARVTLAREAVRYLAAGHDAGEAADRALADFEAVAGEGSVAGLIVLGPGGPGSAYDSEHMGTAVASD